MKRINILAYTESLSDATSFYRAAAPLNQLCRDYDDISVDYIDGQHSQMPSWAILEKYHIIFLQRPASHFAYNLALSAVVCNCKVIIEYDDDLLGVLKDNQTYEYYNNQEVRSIITLFLKRQDFVKIVSTPHLKAVFEKRGAANVHVVPNALHTHLMDRPDFSYDTAQTSFTWRGSATHELDLFEYRDSIHAAIPTIEYIGYYPPTLFRSGFDKHTKAMPILDYYYNLRYNHRSLFFVTLCDNDFNRSKSNIAYIESCWAGAVCLAPDWMEWRVPGCITYTDKADFIAKAKMMQAWDIPERKNHWLLASNYIMENLTLDKVNEKRYELIKTLV